MNHLEVTLTAGCPMMCSYCPQGNYIKGYKEKNTTDKKNMTLEDYKKILENVDRRVNDIHFTGFTEPILNKQWYEIVKHTIEKGYKTSLNTTLYSADSETIDKIVSLGIPVRIHLTDSKLEVPHDVYREFASKYKGSLQFDCFTSEGANKLPPEFSSTKHDIQSRGDNLDISHRVINGPVRCASNRQYSNVVLPNGDVSVCCSDFGLKHIMGNLLVQKLIDIHRSQEMNNFNRKMLEGDASFICNNCVYASPK